MVAGATRQLFRGILSCLPLHIARRNCLQASQFRRLVSTPRPDVKATTVKRRVATPAQNTNGLMCGQPATSGRGRSPHRRRAPSSAPGCALRSPARVDDGDRAVADDIGSGSVKGERPGIARDHAPHQRCQPRRGAIFELEGLVEGDFHGHVSLHGKRTKALAPHSPSRSSETSYEIRPSWTTSMMTETRLIPPCATLETSFYKDGRIPITEPHILHIGNNSLDYLFDNVR